jgi:hypothetical protein
MGLPNGSASGIERMLRCAASVVLPQVYSSDSYAERGKGIHGYVRAVLAGTPPDVALAAVDDDHRETCRRIDWHGLGGDLRDVRSEVAYAIDVRTRTARELGVNVAREYRLFNLTEDEIPGSLDIEGTRFDGIPVILDLKTGWGDVTPAEDNGQLRFFAAARRLLTDAPEVEVRIARLREDGSIRPDSSIVTALDVDCFLDELEDGLSFVRSARKALESGPGVNVSTGSHCRYCPAMSACPAYVNLALAVAGEVSALTMSVSNLTSEQAGVAWRKAKQVDALLESVFDALKARARQEPIALDGGKIIKPIEVNRRDFSSGAALALLRAFGASEAQIAGLYRAHTIEQIREVNAPSAKAPARRRRTAA